MKVLVFCEQRESKLKSYVFEALSQAYKISGSNENNVAAVVVGSNVSPLVEQLKGWGCESAIIIEKDTLANYNILNYACAIEAAINDFSPDLVLGVASPLGRDLFPRLAARFKAPLMTDVVEIDEQAKTVTKPMYAGKILAKCSFNNDSLRLITIRPNVFSAEECSGEAKTRKIDVDFSVDNPLKSIKVIKGESEKVDLTEASVIVSGGRSLGSKDNFNILYECADVLGATVGASRAAVDSGYASHDMQVGQTGKTVNPNLYVACGISGSIQHMAGMRTSKVVVAINTDIEAPIFSVASYGIVADLFEVVPILTRKLKELIN